MDDVVTLPERRRRKLERMIASIERIDALLSAYARTNGGRFIRYGSSATGRLRIGSDIDILADFATHDATGDACDFAEAACAREDLQADVRPLGWCSALLRERALGEGVILT